MPSWNTNLPRELLYFDLSLLKHNLVLYFESIQSKWIKTSILSHAFTFPVGQKQFSVQALNIQRKIRCSTYGNGKRIRLNYTWFPNVLNLQEPQVCTYEGAARKRSICWCVRILLIFFYLSKAQRSRYELCNYSNENLKAHASSKVCATLPPRGQIMYAYNNSLDALGTYTLYKHIIIKYSCFLITFKAYSSLKSVTRLNCRKVCDNSSTKDQYSLKNIYDNVDIGYFKG